jgi:hypothetical protein
MPIVSSTGEQRILTEVLKEYLTDLRTEILDAEDESTRTLLEEKEKTLRGILAGLERRTPVNESPHR